MFGTKFKKDRLIIRNVELHPIANFTEAAVN